MCRRHTKITAQCRRHGGVDGCDAVAGVVGDLAENRGPRALQSVPRDNLPGKGLIATTQDVNFAGVKKFIPTENYPVLMSCEDTHHTRASFLSKRSLCARCIH